MKAKITIFIAAITLFVATTAVAQGTKAYFKKDGVTVFESAISEIDSIVFYNPVEPSIGFIGQTNNSDPIIFTDAEENSLVAFYKNQLTGKIQLALFNKDNESLLMIYGTDGLPIGMYANGYYFLFSNYKGKSVDISTYNEKQELINKETVENEDIFNLIQE